MCVCKSVSMCPPQTDGSVCVCVCVSVGWLGEGGLFVRGLDEAPAGSYLRCKKNSLGERCLSSAESAGYPSLSEYGGK